MLTNLLLLVTMQQPSAQTDRGTTLLIECQAAIQLQENPAVRDEQTQALAALCVGYIDGFTDAIIQDRNPDICFAHATPATIARVYVAYVQQHPKVLDSAKKEGLYLALQDAYSCNSRRK